MPWFRVDDSFHAHPKVLATDADALGLWVVAGTWSSAHLTDGFVPTHVLPRLLPGSADLARKLVAAGLWSRAKGGFQFHDWSEYQPSKDEIEGERKAARDRMRKLRQQRKTAGHPPNGSDERAPNVRGEFGRSSATPTRPDPALIGGALGGPPTPRVDGPPSPRCPEHLEHPTDGNCGPCGDARRARTRWEMADAERRRNAPKCRRHRGQPADNCGLCRSEAVGADPDAQP